MEYATYPAVPENPMARKDARKRASRICGIYFAWQDGTIEYVGQSTDIGKRVGNNQHHALVPEHRISWLEFDAMELFYAEAFYIGVLTPPLNFGKWTTRQEQCRRKVEEHKPGPKSRCDDWLEDEATYAAYLKRRRRSTDRMQSAAINGHCPKAEKRRVAAELSGLIGRRVSVDPSTSQERQR